MHFTLKIVGGGLILSTLFGCSKEELGQSTNMLPISDTEARILAFQDKLERVRGDRNKNNETMSLQDVKWNLEALINYSNPIDGTEDELETFEEIKAERIIATSNGQVGMEEVAASYVWLEARTELEPGEKLLVTDLEIEEEDGETKIKMNALKASSNFASSLWSIYQNGFGPDDYWSVVGNSQYIGESFETLLPYCAGAFEDQNPPMAEGSPGILAKVINRRRFGYLKTNHPNSYFTDIETDWTPYGTFIDTPFINPNDPSPADDNYLDYLFFVATGPDYQMWDCLSPEEMNYYSDEGIPQLISLRRPQGKVFISTVVLWDLIADINPSHGHSIAPRFGVLNTYSSVPGPQ